MRTFSTRLLPLLLLLVGGLTLVARQRDPAGRLRDVKAGMTGQQVRDLLGAPAQKARQVYYQRYLEQWVYDQPEAGRIDLLYRLGVDKEPLVQTVHPLRP